MPGFYTAMYEMIDRLGDEHSSYLSPEDVTREEAYYMGNYDYVGIGVLHQPVPERACHADDKTIDPVAYWEEICRQQARMVDSIQGHDVVKLLGPNVDLSLSIKGRKFNNSYGLHNMPDGEIYTGPVEEL